MADGMRASFLAAPLPPYHLNRWRNCRPSGGFSLRCKKMDLDCGGRGKERVEKSLCGKAGSPSVGALACNQASKLGKACMRLHWLSRCRHGRCTTCARLFAYESWCCWFSSPMSLAVRCVFIYWLYSTTSCSMLCKQAWMLDCYIKIQLGRHLIQAKLQGVLRCLP